MSAINQGKIMIASDIHGSAHWCEKLVRAFEKEKPQKLLLLGDLLYHGPRNPLPDEYSPKRVAELLNSLKTHILCVRGNCDAEVDHMPCCWRAKKRCLPRTGIFSVRKIPPHFVPANFFSTDISMSPATNSCRAESSM